MIENSEIRKEYSELQKQLFYLIPEKWDRIYLYASVEEKMKGLETGELFFYYFPKGILKKNPINVYEIPNKFNLNEDEYIKLVEKLYMEVRKLRDIFKKYKQRLWSNITIRIEGLKFEIEYNYANLTASKYSSTERHIIWEYLNLNLPLEYFTKKERKIIEDYIDEYIYFSPDSEVYQEAIYKNPAKKIVAYNKEKKTEEYVKENAVREEKNKSNMQKDSDDQKYTYKIKGRKRIKKLKEKEKKKPKTYNEQIEEQRNAVKSQILKHL